MVVLEKEGNLLETTAQMIMHQTNDAGIMGSGVAKAIAEKWPYVKEAYALHHKNGMISLGTVHLCRSNFEGEYPYILNLCAQDLYQEKHSFLSTGRPTSYDALDVCLHKVATILKENKITSLAMPYMMSSCRGGANWNIVKTMSLEALKDWDGTLEIWKFPTKE